jgi:DNA-binding ferritin-like protein
MSHSADKCGEIIKLLEQAFALADELGDGYTAHLIARALHEARARQFKMAGRLE